MDEEGWAGEGRKKGAKRGMRDLPFVAFYRYLRMEHRLIEYPGSLPSSYESILVDSYTLIGKGTVKLGRPMIVHPSCRKFRG